MLPSTAHEDSRLSMWLRVRTYAVPPSMIELATRRRTAGDWAGACAAARIDVDLDLRAVARAHGREIAARTVQPLCRTEGIELMGGGGTDLRTGFARALRTRPDAVVVLTDGQTPWPTERPPCRTVAGLFPRTGASYDEHDPDYRPDAPPAWARVVTIGSGAR
ncbi:VWA-like domain-containing protein [Streptomyces puniciscabiei]